MTKDEALKLALDALVNSVDLVVDDAYDAEQLYGKYPTRQAKINGLKVLADKHREAITAIKEALANPEQDRPIESDYISHVAYTRALEAYCDTLEQPATH